MSDSDDESQYSMSEDDEPLTTNGAKKYRRLNTAQCFFRDVEARDAASQKVNDDNVDESPAASSSAGGMTGAVSTMSRNVSVYGEAAFDETPALNLHMGVLDPSGYRFAIEGGYISAQNTPRTAFDVMSAS